jgi:effector-binding domain-containing protein
MLTLPKIVDRKAQPYVALRAELPRSELAAAVDRQFGALFAGLAQRGVAPAGPPFIKYDRVDMERTLELEFGVPVASPVAAEGQMVAGTLPAGRYAVVVYDGPYDDLLDVNAVLIGWASQRGVTWDAQQTPEGDRFACRLETYVTDPREEPDPQRWRTEVAIKVK